MKSRRSFLAGSAAVALAPASHAAASVPSLNECVSLDGDWLFRLDAEPVSRTVAVPHTWQVAPASTETFGIAWYECSFFAPKRWAGSAVRLRFEAVFHSAVVTVNEKSAGEHLRKGYTPFTLDIARLLRFDAPNVVRVRVDNSFDENMLPRGRSSDWAHDGGIYRPVSLLITPYVFVERLEIDALPDLANRSARVNLRAVLRNAGSAAATGTLAAFIDGEAAQTSVPYSIAAGQRATVAASLVMPSAKLWHFDTPHLYIARAHLTSGHEMTDTFGLRTIETRDNGFYLNGERVRLMGVERMAGSNPEFGMAEPSAWIDHDHDDMRALNCLYTRVHWPQDRRVLDYCDRNGILVQTEVPSWGPKTFAGMTGEPSPAIMNNGLEQLREMIADARNHPCLFSWGLCNEVDGQNSVAKTFIRRMYREAKQLDPSRLLTYASHSLFTTPENDVAGEMDYVMFNEYFGSWQKGGVADLARTLDAIHRAFPAKARVISEYGYCACTSDRPENDGIRTGVLIDHDGVFRERPWVAGLIFFCYNDYRTHVGDKGTGVLKQRVHGVVDVYGVPKPSWEALRRESGPIATLTVAGGQIVLTTRNTVPAYTLRGYRVRIVGYGPGDIPLVRSESPLPDLAPGARAVVPLPQMTGVSRSVVDVLRPSGISVATARSQA